MSFTRVLGMCLVGRGFFVFYGVYGLGVFLFGIYFLRVVYLGKLVNVLKFKFY